MKELERIKERVRKLLALSKSENENEAAAALEKANALIEAYSLDETSLGFEQAAVKTTRIYMPWRTVLSNAVTWLYGCHKYHDGETGEFVFTGEPLYVFMAGELYEYLTKAIERIARKQIRKNAKLKFRRDFRYGMADRLYDRIHANGALVSWAPQRESMIERAEEYVQKQVSLEDRTWKKTKHNGKAVSRGMLAADDVSLARQAGYSPAPQIASGRHSQAVQGELF
jgi:hypothetical protein